MTIELSQGESFSAARPVKRQVRVFNIPRVLIFFRRNCLVRLSPIRPTLISRQLPRTLLTMWGKEPIVILRSMSSSPIFPATWARRSEGIPNLSFYGSYWFPTEPFDSSPAAPLSFTDPPLRSDIIPSTICRTTTDIGTPTVFNNRKATRVLLVAELSVARTAARNFSSSLNDAFALDSSLEGLAQSVEQKYVH